MLKEIFAAMLSVFLIFSLCSCDIPQEENDPTEREDISVSKEISEEPRFILKSFFVRPGANILK